MSQACVRGHDVLKIKTTTEIDEFVVQRMQEKAELEKPTISDLVDAMLRLGLAIPGPAGTDPLPLPRFLLGEAEVSGSISPNPRRSIKCRTKRDCWSSTPTCSSMPSMRIRCSATSAAIWCRRLAEIDQNRFPTWSLRTNSSA